MEECVEIPFKIGSNQKWISGISSETTCKDILVAVLKSENLQPSDELNVHHKFALVETWRQVSKVLSPNSLISKIWLAWGEEQQNVIFTVKRIKTERRQNEPAQECQRPRKSVKRRNSKATGKQQVPVDTVHPRALNRSKQLMCKEIQHQMKKIISQGEIIRKHLEIIKDSEHSGESAEHLRPSENPEYNTNTEETPLSKFDQHYPLKHLSEGSDSALNESFLELSSPSQAERREERTPRYQSPPQSSLPSPRSPQSVSCQQSTSNRSPGEICSPLQTSPRSPAETCSPLQTSPRSPAETCSPLQTSPRSPAETCSSLQTSSRSPPETSPLPTSPKSGALENCESVHLLLENIHRINCLLESKEEQVLSLTSTIQVLGDLGESQETGKVIKCFDSEVTKYRDINARLLQEIQENSGHIADMVRNTDIRKKMISQLEFDVNIIERESKKLQCDLTTIQSIGDHLQNSCDDEHSGHSQDIIEPGQTVKLGQTSGLQTELSKKLEYGSDSSSDTGVCSLSSSEGDYSLSTLV